MQQGKVLSLKKEFFKKRTILSLGLSIFLIYIFLSRTTIAEIARHLKNVELPWLLLAFGCHYFSYVFRGDRWKRMIQPAGFSGGTMDLAKIIFLFQSIDCVIPAKLGDLYGAHLMKLNFALSRSFSLGSIFLWRILDFIVVVAFAAGTAFMLFGSKIPPGLVSAMKLTGLTLLVLVAFMVLVFHYHRWLPSNVKSERLKSLIDSFRQGLRIDVKIIPSLLVTTTLIWFLEAGRFFFICKSMTVEVNVIVVLFIASSTTLLTAIPFTPSGLGAVELGMLQLLAFVGIGNSVAYPLIIWDRVIAHWSQIVLGMVLIIFSRSVNLKIWQFEETGVPIQKKV
ncbi:MAG: lysylphosphatidylglycerol synthase transmembrane domain-containing protein [Syntrophobacterales bacterium]